MLDDDERELEDVNEDDALDVGVRDTVIEYVALYDAVEECE